MTTEPTAPASDARTRLSCCIITLNEAAKIARCVEAVRDLADEVVVVDSGSSDGTPDIARACGARVIHNPWPGYGQQKRFAEDLAANDWILNLDADEVVTPELKANIRAALAGGRFPAWRFRIVTVYPGRDRPRLWADNRAFVRLYDRRVARFKDHSTNDTVDINPRRVGQLKGIALHYSIDSLAHLRAKRERYIVQQAQALRKPVPVVLARLPFEYFTTFFRYYVTSRNCTGGLFGLRLSHMMAGMRVKRLWLMLRVELDRRRGGEGRV